MRPACSVVTPFAVVAPPPVNVILLALMCTVTVGMADDAASAVVAADTSPVVVTIAAADATAKARARVERIRMCFPQRRGFVRRTLARARCGRLPFAQNHLQL